MVLEISSTPNNFTFKIWDWGRLGLDGKPRPINVEGGLKVIEWERGTKYTMSKMQTRLSTYSGLSFDRLQMKIYDLNNYIDKQIMLMLYRNWISLTNKKTN